MDNNNAHDIVFETDDSDSGAPHPTASTHAGPTSINRQSPMTPEAQQELVDMLMTVEDYDDMPSLSEASSSESDVENIVSNSNLGAQDIQIPTQQAQRNNASTPSSSQSTSLSSSPPPSSSASSPTPQPQRSNRRARVEDDDDEDRDRRHPSQRVGDQPSTSDPLFVPLFTSFRDFGAALGAGYFNPMPNSNPSGNGSTPNTNSTNSNTNSTPVHPAPSSQSQGQLQNPNGPTNRPPPMHFVDYEFSIVMDGSGRTPQPIRRAQHQPPPSNAPNSQEQPDGNPPTGTPSGPTPGATGVPPNISFNPPIPFGNLATLLGIPFPLPGGGFGFPPLPEEKEDPERARMLVDGLEEVPVGLVRRLERVGTGGGGMGEDETKGGDVGCAICWDRLLPEKVEQDREEEPTEIQAGSERMIVDNEAGDEEMAESKYPKVVSLPCAHVFHAECLIPWFSRPRHTTCPTCRFNIDPENLTYVSARQRRQEQRRADNDNDNEPSENNAEELPMNPAPATPAPTDIGGQPPQPGGQHPVIDLGGGFAGIIQMLNAQGQPQQQAHTAANGAAPSGTQPQVQGPPFVMPTPMPAGGPGHYFAARGGQMPMPMPVPLMAVPLNAEGVPIPMQMHMPWRVVADPFHLATGGANVPNRAPDANNANTTPATTVNEPSPTDSDTDAPQDQPPHRHPRFVADVVRISVDMVFDGRLTRGGNQGPTNNPAVPQPAGGSGNAPQNGRNATDEQVVDDDDHNFDDGLPELVPMDDATQEGQFTQFFDLLGANGVNLAQNTGNPATNDSPDQPTPETQPGAAQPQPQHRDPHGLPFAGIHVAGTGRSLEEAFNRALSRLRNQMGQQTQEGQNTQPAEGEAAGVTADVDAPPPLQPHADGQEQGGAQRPWQFMPMPFMNFGTPMRAQPQGPKRPWTPPPPPGPTLRQRIEKRERDAELRCHDVSCGLGPSDEDPLGYDAGVLGTVHQLSIIISKAAGDAEEVEKPVCEHRFHTSCLVSAERVALRGAEASMNETGEVEVSCPVCRGAGCVTKEQWDEGVRALQ